ncbi:hypothetical protein EOL70_20010 [Leucothrix sargassi]|nr:hypothetical protein EOL70_20010 [Leucothrix sargassi]
MEFSLQILALLFFVALVAGWVDAIAGGGGLIAMPALIIAGLSPASALATNKLQGSIGTLTASLYFLRKKVVKLSDMKLAILMTFLGSVLGSWLVLQVDTQYLLMVLPALLITMGLYFLFSPHISDQERKQKLSVIAFALLITPLLGFYDGFFGPGTGSFMALAFVMLLGYGLPKATAHAKILNFVSNISSLGYFLLFGDVNWVAGLVMMCGQFVGATLGAKMIIDKGSKLIKPVVVTVCFLMSAHILFELYN